jgi:glycosyltransferase involved in cell wall biosynthesis
LKFLANQINEEKLNDCIRIIISDNCSSDDTRHVVSAFINDNDLINIKYYRTKENIGLEKNVINVLSNATSKYILWVGDDDTLAKGYLIYCYNKILNNAKIGCVIPGITKVYEDGTEVQIRTPDFDEIELNPCFESVLRLSYLGHQLSGLLLLRENLLDNYLKGEKFRNIYLFIYFVTDRVQQYSTVFAPSYRTRVPVFNVKFWEYNNIGLLDEVFKSYYPFLKIYGKRKVGKLILFFLIQQSAFRLNIHYKHPFRLFKQGVILIKELPFFSFMTYFGIFKILGKEYLISFKRN